MTVFLRIANNHIDLMFIRQYAPLRKRCGSSFLMNILSGLYKPDSGTMMIRGKEVRFLPERLLQGIWLIHQHFKLRTLTVENIILGDARTLYWGEIHERENPKAQ